MRELGVVSFKNTDSCLCADVIKQGEILRYLSFYLQKRNILSNQAGPNDHCVLYNKGQGKNNVSPYCDGIIMWVDTSFQARYSTSQMDI